MSCNNTNRSNSSESPQNIIISSERLRDIFHKEKDKHVFPYGWLLSVALTLFVCWIETETYTQFLGISSDQVKTCVCLLWIMAFVIWLIMFLRAALSEDKSIDPNVNWDEMFKNIVNESANKLEKNLILLFVKYGKSGPKFLVQRKVSWNHSYFFPYVKDNYGDKLLNDVKVVRDSIHSTLGFPEHVKIKYHHISRGDFKSIKYNSEKIPQHFEFRFALISSKFPFLSNYVYQHLENDSMPYEWKSLDELIQDPPSYANNRDVIEQVQIILGEIRSEYDRQIGNLPSKVIWNFDKRCNRGCSFCAYGDTCCPSNVSFEEKKKIIKSLSVLKISDLDIAVGDMVDIEELKRIVKEAHDLLPNTKLSLTATSTVLKNILKDKKNIIINKKVDCIDVSIDFLKPTIEQGILRKGDYNEENLKIVEELKNKHINVRVQCVINEKTTLESLTDLIKKLKTLDVHDILLLRLMPVGKLDKDAYPKDLLDKNKYLDLLSSIKSFKGVRLHCSLNGLLDKDSSKELTCDMGCRKLGISMNGDVYACPWAEHLKSKDNPFLLGNILADPSLESLISNNETYKTAIKRKEENQPHCKIFAYLYGDNPYGAHDELYR